MGKAMQPLTRYRELLKRITLFVFLYRRWWPCLLKLGTAQQRRRMCSIATREVFFCSCACHCATCTSLALSSVHLPVNLNLHGGQYSSAAQFGQIARVIKHAQEDEH